MSSLEWHRRAHGMYCSCSYLNVYSLYLQTIRREFHAGAVLMARKKTKEVVLTKAQLAARAKKRAAKKTNIYDAEKMKLLDAIQVLRVRCFRHACRCSRLTGALGSRSCFSERDV